MGFKKKKKKIFKKKCLIIKKANLVFIILSVLDHRDYGRENLLVGTPWATLSDKQHVMYHATHRIVHIRAFYTSCGALTD